MPIDEHDQRQIEKFQARLLPALSEVRKWQIAINAVYEAADESPPYDLEDPGADTTPSQGPRRTYGRAEFFEQPLATVVKRLINDNGALDIDEIYDLMLAGGYNFKGLSSDKAKSNMKISLGKNMAFGCTSKGHYTLASGSASRRDRSSSHTKEGGAAASQAGDAQTSASAAESDANATAEGSRE